jgi:hypothetical protein
MTLHGMALRAIYRSTAFFMAGFALTVESIRSLGRLFFIVGKMAFSTRGRLIALIFNVMVAVYTGNFISRFGYVLFMVEQNISPGAFQHDSYGFLGRFFRKSRITYNPHYKHYGCKTISNDSFLFYFHPVSSAL